MPASRPYVFLMCIQCDGLDADTLLNTLMFTVAKGQPVHHQSWVNPTLSAMSYESETTARRRQGTVMQLPGVFGDRQAGHDHKLGELF